MLNYTLVRDNVPELIKQSGETCDYATIQTDALYATFLRAKLLATVELFLKTNHISELIDMQELINEICALSGVDRESFAKECEAKVEQQGSFHNRIVMFYNAEETSEPATEAKEEAPVSEASEVTTEESAG